MGQGAAQAPAPGDAAAASAAAAVATVAGPTAAAVTNATPGTVVGSVGAINPLAWLTGGGQTQPGISGGVAGTGVPNPGADPSNQA
jgi:hypothetical protein